MTFVVVGMIGVLFMAVVFVVFVGGEFFHGGFLGEFHAVEGVGVGDVSVMRCSDGIVFLIGGSREEMMLGCELEMVSRFLVGIKGEMVEFVIVF